MTSSIYLLKGEILRNEDELERLFDELTKTKDDLRETHDLAFNVDFLRDKDKYDETLYPVDNSQLEKMRILEEKVVSTIFRLTFLRESEEFRTSAPLLHFPVFFFKSLPTKFPTKISCQNFPICHLGPRGAWGIPNGRWGNFIFENSRSYGINHKLFPFFFNKKKEMK